MVRFDYKDVSWTKFQEEVDQALVRVIEGLNVLSPEDSNVYSNFKSLIPRIKAQVVKKTFFKPLLRAKHAFIKPMKWVFHKRVGED